MCILFRSGMRSVKTLYNFQITSGDHRLNLLAFSQHFIYPHSSNGPVSVNVHLLARGFLIHEVIRKPKHRVQLVAQIQSPLRDSITPHKEEAWLCNTLYMRTLGIHISHRDRAGSCHAKRVASLLNTSSHTHTQKRKLMWKVMNAWLVCRIFSFPIHASRCILDKSELRDIPAKMFCFCFWKTSNLAAARGRWI